MHGALANHLRVDRAGLGGRVRRRLGVDPETVDADSVCAAVLSGLWVQGFCDAVGAGISFR